jgi:hypothetical protein
LDGLLHGFDICNFQEREADNLGHVGEQGIWSRLMPFNVYKRLGDGLAAHGAIPVQQVPYVVIPLWFSAGEPGEESHGAMWCRT